MLIQDAIKSGKPFRLPHWHDDIYLIVYEGGFAHLKDLVRTEIEVGDLVSDKWELKYNCEVCKDTGKVYGYYVDENLKPIASVPCPKCSPKPKTWKTVKLYAPMIKCHTGNYEMYYNADDGDYKQGYKRSKEEWEKFENFESWHVIEVEVEE